MSTALSSPVAATSAAPAPRADRARRSASWRSLLPIAVVLLGGCATFEPEVPSPASHAAEWPASWQAPLPHNGRLEDLNNWWAQFDDPLLVRLIDAAERISLNVAVARTRIEQSHATLVAAGAAALPAIQLTGSAARGKDKPEHPIATNMSAGLQASWELDLFGGLAAGARAAQGRLESDRAAWHDARVSVAAEVATRYLELRTCESQLQLAIADGDSRSTTSRLTERLMSSGFEALATTELARASAAEGMVNVSQQRTRCELAIKSLVELTGTPEPELRTQLGARIARIPRPVQLDVPRVPAQALAQRPDLTRAAHELIAASADVSQAKAQAFPRIVLNGSIGPARVASAMTSTSGTVWSLGPLSLILPVFDGGIRRANIDAASARYEEAAVAYRARLRLAVREVEQALVSLHGVAERSGDARRAARGFRASFVATEARQRAGMASLFDLEDARRRDLQAQITLVDLERERVGAWISLYRALGGGWDTDPSLRPANRHGAAG